LIRATEYCIQIFQVEFLRLFHQSLIHYKKLCKCHNEPPPSTTIKKEKKRKKKSQKGPQLRPRENLGLLEELTLLPSEATNVQKLPQGVFPKRIQKRVFFK
jgi:hypothetical protein